MHFFLYTSLVTYTEKGLKDRTASLDRIGAFSCSLQDQGGLYSIFWLKDDRSAQGGPAVNNTLGLFRTDDKE